MGLLNGIVVRTAPYMPKFIIGKIASRYVAGDSIEDGISLVQKLNQKGFSGTLDLLGEEVTDITKASKITKSYCSILDAIEDAGVDCNISLKLTSMGLNIDREICWSNFKKVLDTAKKSNNFIRIDMEDSSVTQLTIDMYKRAKAYYPKVGTVLQAYMKRTIDDVSDLLDDNPNLRICKGAYKESEDIAYQGREEIRNNYLQAASMMFSKGAYVALATHDTTLIKSLEEMIAEKEISSDAYEFQALSGVPVEKTLERLVEENHKVRYYIPFGSEWHAYSLRRMKENPDIWKYTLKALFFRSRHRK